MATFEKVTPVTEDEADDIRVTLELDEGEVECEILTIFEANNRDYIALKWDCTDRDCCMTCQNIFPRNFW